MKPDVAEEVCAVCRVPAKQRCAGCRSVFYCGREHQKAHWKEHCRNCKCYKLVENEKLGRHYTAARRIEAGELVIQEDEPLVQGPQQQTVPVCLGCCAPLAADGARPCDECGWPLCLACRKHGPECEFTRRYRDSKVSITGFGLAHPTYKCISVVRALSLRDREPRLYERFARLASGEREAEFEGAREIARFVRRFFGELQIEEEEIARVAGILQINGHEVPISEPAQIAVFDVSSYLEHSCKANCSKSFTNDGGIVIRAAMTIEKGDHITICYTDPLWGTADRRHHLLRTKFFECTCPRCSDPTEFGTMFNAIKCRNSSCPGNMLPGSFLLSGDLPDYECAKCGARLASAEVDATLERIGRELAGTRKDDPEACRAFLARQRPVLHDNHFYATDARLALCQMIGQQEGGLPALDTEAISEKILMCKKLDDLMRIIVPAENRVRGLLLFEMHAAIAEFGRRQDQDQLIKILQESRRILKEAYDLLKHEPDILPEGKIAKTARRNLREMEVILTRLCQNTVAPL